MGLSSLPAPSEGMLSILLVNTAMSISIVKGIVRSILHVVGIRFSSASSSSSLAPSDQSDNYYPEEPYDFGLSTSDYNYINEFRSQTPAVQFKSVCGCKRQDNDCSVCLTGFEPESEINKLNCGHVFHRMCLEKWIDYWNITCPLCRNPLLPQEELSSPPSFFW